MHVVTNTSDTKSRTSAGYFTRTELNQILNVYARFVSSGEWRDYALDHLDGMAVFSIYRSSVEQPLFTVEKHKLKGRIYAQNSTIRPFGHGLGQMMLPKALPKYPWMVSLLVLSSKIPKTVTSAIIFR